jgi:UDP-glucose 4-epimerase
MTVTILVTGHRGYIGSVLFRMLSDLPEIDNVIGYDLVDDQDILDYQQLVDTMRKCNPDIVVHLAGTTNMACSANVKMAIRTNGCGTNNVLKAMKEVGCQHIVYASSGAVYGNNKQIPYKENTTVRPCTPYGISKILGEYAIYNHYELNENRGNYVILRLFNVVGTSMYRDIEMIHDFGRDKLFPALECGYVTVYGTDYATFDGTCERDYISLEDTCEALLCGISIVACRLHIREIINICSGETFSVKSIIDIWNNMALRIKASNRSDIDRLPYVFSTNGPRRKGDSAKICGSNKKAMKLLEWIPRKKIEDIIYDLAQYKKW